MFCILIPLPEDCIPIPLADDIIPLPLGIMPPLLPIPFGTKDGRPRTGGIPLIDPLGLIILPDVMGGLPGPLLLILMLLIALPLFITTPPLPLPNISVITSK